ncbi:hypothetical protein GUJ93_ZPchr0011g27831 [Zizania palustris]|uniref:Uncharacterized protein n=1 Tax=Zizania palustris TaxID=103762 RepID=A0A8J5WG92_ZIZPA|nr:hypothetical protein GUJ93_ZPchr0011g27831 [Zizania palustris]
MLSRLILGCWKLPAPVLLKEMTDFEVALEMNVRPCTSSSRHLCPPTPLIRQLEILEKQETYAVLKGILCNIAYNSNAFSGICGTERTLSPM